jgi:uncharacterized protein (TIGR02646 family)
MRPVVTGEPPLDAEGCVKQFAKYQDARPDLLERLGDYCSYCEVQLDVSLALEHVQPKSLHPELECAWDNLLLGCAKCNSHKGDDPIVLDDYYWPDRDNTFRAFTYSEGGIVSVSPELSTDQRDRARRTLALFGLDEGPVATDEGAIERWRKRNRAWEAAVRSRGHLVADPSPQMREEVVANALGRGYFSVWMTVFRDDTDMLRRFIEAFPGTSHECFDDDGQPVPRPGRAL